MADAISGRAVARHSQITTLNFHGTDILVRAGDSPSTTLVAMKPVVDGMGLTWQPQHAKLIAHPVLGPTITEIVTVAEDGKLRTMAALPLNRLHFWLATIHANKVKPALRETVITYQTEAADVLFEHFFGKKLRTRQAGHVARGTDQFTEPMKWSPAHPDPAIPHVDGRYLVHVSGGRIAHVTDVRNSCVVDGSNPVNVQTFLREYLDPVAIPVALETITYRASICLRHGPKGAPVPAIFRAPEPSHEARVLSIIRTAGRISRQDLLRRLQHRMKAAELDRVLTALERGVKITVSVMAPHMGRPGTWYTAT